MLNVVSVHVYMICVLAIFTTVTANVCPVISYFVVDVCADMPNSQTGIDVFLNINNLGNAGSCHCEITIEGGAVPGQIQTILFNKRNQVTANNCPGMTVNIAELGHIFALEPCTIHNNIRVENSQNGMTMHILKHFKQKPTMSEVCFFVGFRDLEGNVTANKKQTTVTCSRKNDGRKVRSTTSNASLELSAEPSLSFKAMDNFESQPTSSKQPEYVKEISFSTMDISNKGPSSNESFLKVQQIQQPLQSFNSEFLQLRSTQIPQDHIGHQQEQIGKTFLHTHHSGDTDTMNNTQAHHHTGSSVNPGLGSHRDHSTEKPQSYHDQGMVIPSGHRHTANPKFDFHAKTSKGNKPTHVGRPLTLVPLKPGSLQQHDSIKFQKQISNPQQHQTENSQVNHQTVGPRLWLTVFEFNSEFSTLNGSSVGSRTHSSNTAMSAAEKMREVPGRLSASPNVKLSSASAGDPIGTLFKVRTLCSGSVQFLPQIKTMYILGLLILVYYGL